MDGTLPSLPRMGSGCHPPLPYRPSTWLGALQAPRFPAHDEHQHDVGRPSRHTLRLCRWLRPWRVNNDIPFPRLSSLLLCSLDLASPPKRKPASLPDPPGAAKANQRAIFVFQALARNDSRKAQPGLMELCLCSASKPALGHGAGAAFLLAQAGCSEVC